MATTNNNATQAGANPSIWFRFDGPIAHDNLLSLRATAKTADHIQSAIDRAYLDVRYGTVVKHQKLKQHDYEVTEFIVLPSQPGSYIQEVVAKVGSEFARSAIDRINAALLRAYEKTNEPQGEAGTSLQQQAIQRKQVYDAGQEAQNFQEFLNSELNLLSASYSERSIIKEADQILGLIRQDNYAGSTFEISTYGNQAGPIFHFDTERSRRFHKIVSERRLGKPLIIDIELRSLDAGKNNQKPTGKAKNLHTGKECSMQIPDPVVFGNLTRHLRKVNRKVLRIAACPIFEYDAWDPEAGDIVVIELIGVAS